MALDVERLAKVCLEAAELDDILSDPLTYDANDDVTIRRSWPEVKARLVELGAAEDERDEAREDADDCRAAARTEESMRKEAEAERDAAQARVKELEGKSNG